jgi:hypothetical protein
LSGLSAGVWMHQLSTFGCAFWAHGAQLELWKYSSFSAQKRRQLRAVDPIRATTPVRMEDVIFWSFEFFENLISGPRNTTGVSPVFFYEDMGQTPVVQKNGGTKPTPQSWLNM